MKELLLTSFAGSWVLGLQEAESLTFDVRELPAVDTPAAHTGITTADASVRQAEELLLEGFERLQQTIPCLEETAFPHYAAGLST